MCFIQLMTVVYQSSSDPGIHGTIQSAVILHRFVFRANRECAVTRTIMLFVLDLENVIEKKNGLLRI